MLCHRAVIGSGGQHHGYAPLRGCFHIHHVISDTGPPDDLQVRGGFDSFGIHMADPGNYGVSVSNVCLVFRHITGVQHLGVAVFQQIHGFRYNRVGKNKFHGNPPYFFLFTDSRMA